MKKYMQCVVTRFSCRLPNAHASLISMSCKICRHEKEEKNNNKNNYINNKELHAYMLREIGDQYM